LRRARATLRDRWPGGRLDWAPAEESDAEQRRLRRFSTVEQPSMFAAFGLPAGL
jgi:RNA polymerase sigma-70 factor (ECF subfamily)